LLARNRILQYPIENKLSNYPQALASSMLSILLYIGHAFIFGWCFKKLSLYQNVFLNGPNPSLFLNNSPPTQFCPIKRPNTLTARSWFLVKKQDTLVSYSKQVELFISHFKFLNLNYIKEHNSGLYFCLVKKNKTATQTFLNRPCPYSVLNGSFAH